MSESFNPEHNIPHTNENTSIEAEEQQEQMENGEEISSEVQEQDDSETQAFSNEELEELKGGIQNDIESRTRLEEGGLSETPKAQELEEDIEEQREEYSQRESGRKLSQETLQNLKRRVSAFVLAGMSMLGSVSEVQAFIQRGNPQKAAMIEKQSDLEQKNTEEQDEQRQVFLKQGNLQKDARIEDLEDSEEEVDSSSEEGKNTMQEQRGNNLFNDEDLPSVEEAREELEAPTQHNYEDLGDVNEHEAGDVVNWGDHLEEERDIRTSSAYEIVQGSGMEVTPEGHCIQTVKHVVEEDGEPVEMQFYNGLEPGPKIRENHEVITLPNRDMAIVVPADLESIEGCIDYFEQRGEEVPEDAKAFYEKYKGEQLVHVSMRDRDIDRSDGEYTDQPYAFSGEVSAIQPDSLVQENLNGIVLMLSEEQTTNGSSGSPILNKEGEIVANHAGIIARGNFQQSLAKEQQKSEEEQDEEYIQALKKAINTIEDGGSVSMIVPQTQGSVSYIQEQLYELKEQKVDDENSE